MGSITLRATLPPRLPAESDRRRRKGDPLPGDGRDGGLLGLLTDLKSFLRGLLGEQSILLRSLSRLRARVPLVDLAPRVRRVAVAS